jgi:hypothetical protein
MSEHFRSGFQLRDLAKPQAFKTVMNAHEFFSDDGVLISEKALIAELRSPVSPRWNLTGQDVE